MFSHERVLLHAAGEGKRGARKKKRGRGGRWWSARRTGKYEKKTLGMMEWNSMHGNRGKKPKVT